MGNKGRKMSESVKEAVKELLQSQEVDSIEDLFETLPEKTLLELGKKVQHTDFAVRFYNKPQHAKFYKNKEELIRVVRHVWAVGAFNHREQILAVLQKSLL